MQLSQITILSLVQGITEFLPISSSAHLVLIAKLTNWQDQGLVFDLAMHIGSLIAVIVFFWQDLQTIIKSGVISIFTRKLNKNSKLFFAIGFATVPVGLFGLLFSDFIEINLRSILIIALTSIFFGILLLFADILAKKKQHRNEYQLKWHEVMIIGFFQALALIPGTSRSGATITGGLFLGLSREASLRFSFLLAIPVIILGGGLKFWGIVDGSIQVNIGFLLLSIFLSFIFAYITIYFFLKTINKIGMLPFVIYRVILGIVLIVYLLV